MKEKNNANVTFCNSKFGLMGNFDKLHAGCLNNHVVKAHDGKKQFTCDICNANFVLNVTFNTHIETVHEEKKQFKCDICNASFGLKYHLKMHVLTVHEGKKQFKCNICNVSFGLKHQCLFRLDFKLNPHEQNSQENVILSMRYHH